MLTIDASYGLEMPTFEFLSLIQTHGFIKLCSVFTHLDAMKTNKAMQKTKKALKHRIWRDVYPGAKCFGISGLMRSAKYPKNDMRQISLWLTRQKFRPLKWRNEHPHLLVDRIQGSTVFGFVRGPRFKANNVPVHIPGLGDFSASRIQLAPDPLPLADPTTGKTLKKRCLAYGPLSGQLGDIHFDENTRYIELEQIIYSPDSTLTEPAERKAYSGRGVEIIRKLHEGMTIPSPQLSLFPGSEPVDQHHMNNEQDLDMETYGDVPKKKSTFSHKSEVKERNALQQLVYGPLEEQSDDNQEEEEDDDSQAEEFFVRRDLRRNTSNDSQDNESDVDDDDLRPEVNMDEDMIRSRFVKRREDIDDEVHGDFELMSEDSESVNDDEDNYENQSESNDSLDETQSEMEKARKINAAAKEASAVAKQQDTEDDDDHNDDDERDVMAAAKREQSRLAALRTVELGESPDISVAGISSGNYARIELADLPDNFEQLYDHCKPMIIGGLLEHEVVQDKTQLPFAICRVRRHRWHPKILKSRDPLILSCGWRRFQSAPIYAIEDASEKRMRFLKYTPEHMHCIAVMRLPGIAPNTPIIGFHSIDPDCPNFRACMIGLVTASVAASPVVKKLKLTGVPYKVEKKSAFIQGMFSTALEVARFEGAALKTVSGIRGAIKKALVTNSSTSHKPGAFRATFEDKILLSDIVICRLWLPVDPPDYHFAYLSLLKQDDQNNQAMARTTSQVRRDERIPIPVNPDSVYGINTIDRSHPRSFAPHTIPQKLVDQLPYRSKPKLMTKRSESSYHARRNKAGAITAPPQPSVQTKRISKMIQALNTIRNDAQARRKAKRTKRSAEHAKAQEKIRLKAQPSIKAKAKRAYAQMGADQARKRAKFASAPDA